MRGDKCNEPLSYIREGGIAKGGPFQDVKGGGGRTKKRSQKRRRVRVRRKK